MRLHATGRDLIITEKERLISGSINIYTCEFTLDSSWDGYMVTAVFSTANRLVNKAVVDGKCEIPTEVLRPNTRLRIGIFGNDGVRTRPTTYSEWIPVEQGADTGGRTGRPPSTTVYEEWMNALDKQYDEWAKAEAEREAAEKLRGNSAVYVGSGDIPDGYNIQIDPEGEYVFGGPKIENGTWWVWDEDTGDYADTGVPATGPKGDPGGAVLTEADKADLVAQVLAALPNGDDTEYPEGGGTFTFTVDGTSYEAEEGMTWRQFIESEYNVKKECNCGCGAMYSTFDIQWGVDEGVGTGWECSPGSSVYYEESSEGYVRPDDVIENGRSYLVFEGYPGDYGNGEEEEGWYTGQCDECGEYLNGDGTCPNGCDPKGGYEDEDLCIYCGSSIGDDGICTHCGYNTTGHCLACGTELDGCVCPNCGQTYHHSEGPNCVGCGKEDIWE